MRPVTRGASPQQGDFNPYSDAKLYLISRLGSYCSYCERKLYTNIAVEHIQPKGLPQYAHLEFSWRNFLLACVNCNSSKSSKNVVLSDILLPDRDNTYIALTYQPDGQIVPSVAVTPGQQILAGRTLALTDLNKAIRQTTDENGALIAMDRASQRMEAWGTAEVALANWVGSPSPALLQMVVLLAQATGFFSIWMAVFQGHPAVQQSLIDAFPGTAGSGCFVAPNATVGSPHPNVDQMDHGSKA